MKIKSDFITNSSSTSFFFIFKGKRKKQLFEAIRNHSKVFNLKFKEPDMEEYKCTVENIIEGIEKALKKRSKYEHETCKIESLNEYIIDTREEIKYYEEKDLKLEENKWLIGYKETELKRLNKLIDNLEKFIHEKGFTNYLEIEFGDNDGHLHGGPYAAMDYKKPKIISDDLILLNESRH